MSQDPDSASEQNPVAAQIIVAAQQTPSGMSSDEDMEPSMDTAPPEEAMVEAFIHTLGGQLTAMEEMTPSATDIADMISLIEYSKLRDHFVVS